MKKRVLSILLTFILVLGLSVTSFAATQINDPNSVYNGTYPVTVKIDNNDDQTIDSTIIVYLNANGTYVDSSGTTHAKYTNPGSHTIENATMATAFDAIYATGLVDQLSEVQYVDSDWLPTGVYGIAFNKFNNLAGRSEAITGGGTRYYYWSFDVTYDSGYTEMPAANYATHYNVTNASGAITNPISTVTLTYTSYDYIP